MWQGNRKENTDREQSSAMFPISKRFVLKASGWEVPQSIHPQMRGMTYPTDMPLLHLEIFYYSCVSCLSILHIYNVNVTAI
jgi:hypothetical protein